MHSVKYSTWSIGSIILLSVFCVRGEAANEVAGGLLGAAAITAAVSPIAIAGIQAGADKAIAGINAETTVAVAGIQSETTKYLAAAQAEVALAQAQTSMEINKINNDGQTERLGMQLAELRASREDAMAAEREKRWMEMYYNEQRLQVAKDQADANYKLAQATLQAQLVQAGLVSGSKRIDSSAGLTVTRTGLASGKGSTNTSGNLGLSRVQSQSGSLSILRGMDGQITFNGNSGPRSETSKRLLAAAMGGQYASRDSAYRGISLSQGSTRDIRFRAVADNSISPQPARSPSSLAAAQWEGDRRDSQPVTQAGGHSGGSRGAR